MIALLAYLFMAIDEKEQRNAMRFLAGGLAIIVLLAYAHRTFAEKYLRIDENGRLWECTSRWWGRQVFKDRLRLQSLDDWKDGKEHDEPDGQVWFIEDSGEWKPYDFRSDAHLYDRPEDDDGRWRTP